ncbi:MAG: hypothetical protein R2752_09270 [Vicinamibacterales bacterium]
MARAPHDTQARTIAAMILVAGLLGCTVAARVAQDPPAPPASGPLPRAVAFLSTEVPRWRREEGCYSCHNNGDAARALMRAARAGFDVAAPLADTLAFLGNPSRWEGGRKGPFEDRVLARIQFAGALVTAVETGLAPPDALPAAARLVAADQRPDGSWRLDASDSLGTPATYGTALVTWAARRVLVAAAIDDDGARDAIARATAFLVARDPATTPDAAAVVLALADDAGAPAVAAHRTARDRLLAWQTPGGGWGPYPTVRPEPFDTAIAVLALLDVRPDATARAAARRGQAFLRSTIQADGAWLETTRPAGQLSYAQRLSTAGWATLALLADDADVTGTGPLRGR